MRKQLEALVSKIETLRDAAQEKADESERDATVERYENIAEALEAAIENVQEAIDAFN